VPGVLTGSFAVTTPMPDAVRVQGRNCSSAKNEKPTKIKIKIK